MVSLSNHEIGRAILRQAQDEDFYKSSTGFDKLRMRAFYLGAIMSSGRTTASNSSAET